MFLFCLVFAMFCARLFICLGRFCWLCVLFFVALWSPAGKGLTSWLSCVLYLVTFPNESWSTSESRVRLAP